MNYIYFKNYRYFVNYSLYHFILNKNNLEIINIKSFLFHILWLSKLTKQADEIFRNNKINKSVLKCISMKKY